MQGASNARDLGGWPTEGGGRVRFGQVFRSAALDRLTAADAAVLAGAGLRSVVDLRGERERAYAPSRLQALPGVAVHLLPIDPSLGASLREIATRREATGAEALALMRRAYAAYALDWAHRYAAMFELLLDATQRPLLFHCTAGKDRTGFGAALLLAALGVPRAAIREDYLATGRLWRGDAAIEALLPRAVAPVLMGVHGALLDDTFAAIDAAHGSMEAYLGQRLGLDAARLERLRAALVE